MTEAATLAGVAARRSAMYWLLAETFLTSPNEPFVARLRHGLAAISSSETPGALATGLLAEALPDAGDAAGIIRLAVEYTRLFGGISPSYGPPPPFEGVHRGMAADAAVAVTKCYSDAGLAAIDAAAPPDHLGIELKFIALLCHGESEAWRENRGAGAIQALQRQRAFLDDHLLQWAPDYLPIVQAQAREEFYRNLPQLALNAMTEDRASIEDLLVNARDTNRFA